MAGEVRASRLEIAADLGFLRLKVEAITAKKEDLGCCCKVSGVD